jgi:hypothetical protein
MDFDVGGEHVRTVCWVDDAYYGFFERLVANISDN